MSIPEDDRQFEEVRIAKVHKEKEGWSITREDGWCFHVEAKHGVEPCEGDVARYYGEGIGRTVRGLSLNGVTVFYKTKEEQAAEHQQWCENLDRERRERFEKAKPALDASYQALPEVFQQRIDRFRAANPAFRWKHEGYEMFTCEQAAIIAGAFESADQIDAFYKLSFEAQRAMVPGISDGHSGNTFGCACLLAKLYKTDPAKVIVIPGAMAPLVGTADYSESEEG